MSSDEAGFQPGQTKVGVVVVHGVGETEIGYAVNGLAGTLAGTVPGYKLESHSEVIRLGETPVKMLASGPQKIPGSHFRIVRRRASHPEAGTITFSELYWADLTDVQPGRINTLLGLFRVIFESHHLVAGMLDRSAGFASWLLRWLLLVSSWLMRGPIAAMTIATSAICALLLYGPVPGTSTGGLAGLFASIGTADKFTAVQLILCLFSIGVLAWIAVYRDISWYDTIFWLAIVTAALVILNTQGSLPALLAKVPDLAFADNAGGDCLIAAKSGACYISRLYSIIVWGWRLWAVLMLAAILLFCVAATLKSKNMAAFAVAPAATSISIVILQFMLWTMIVVTALFPMLSRAEDIPDLIRIRDMLASKGELDPLLATLGKNSTLMKLLEVPSVELDWIKRFKFVYGATALTLSIFGVLLFAVMGSRLIVARTGAKDLSSAAAHMPRLLFNGVLVGWLIIACVLVIGSILLIALWERQHPELLTQAKELLLPFAAVVGVAIPFLLTERLSNAVHIARDLIDHHYSLNIETATYFFPSLFRQRHARPRRAQIQHRLTALLAALVEKEQFDRIVFVAHSQGSVVVADYLWDNGPGYHALGGAKANLLTLGSPLGNIYERYFFAYAPGRPVPEGLANRLSRWINLYRVKDYVGGPVTAPAGVTLENKAMPVGGHMDYWKAPEVAEALDALIRGKSV